MGNLFENTSPTSIMSETHFLLLRITVLGILYRNFASLVDDVKEDEVLLFQKSQISPDLAS